MPYETIIYDRDVLYAEVWAEPVTKVAARYRISNVAFAKVCRSLRIPLPGRGYWAQVAAGQKIPRPELPPMPEGERSRYQVSRPIVEPLDVPQDIADKIVNEKNGGAAIVVSETLHASHKLVSSAAKLLGESMPNRYGVLLCRQQCLDIKVGPKSIDRALRIMNALIVGLEQRGLRVEVTEVTAHRDNDYWVNASNPSNATRVLVDGEWVIFGITEKLSPKETPAPSSFARLHGKTSIMTNVPSGKLILEIKNGRGGTRSSWKDNDRQRIEACLNNFVSHLYVTAQHLKCVRAEREQKQQEQAAEKRKQDEQQQQAAEEARLAKALEEEMQRWRTANEIRIYLDAMRGVVPKGQKKLSPTSPLAKYLEWVRSYADRIDPIAMLRRELANS